MFLTSSFLHIQIEFKTIIFITKENIMYSILIVSLIVLMVTIFGTNGLIQKLKRVKNDPTYSETQDEIIGNCMLINILNPIIMVIIVFLGV